MTAQLKPITQTATTAGSTSAGLYSLCFTNTGTTNVTVCGAVLVPGATVEYGGYGLPLTAVAYDATGGELRIDGEMISPTYNNDTVENIIRGAIQSALRLSRDNIQTDVIQYAIDAFNIRGRMIWDSWKWDQIKMQDFTVVPNADGIVVMPAEVDVVRAVYIGGQNGGAVRPHNEEQTVYGTAKPLTPTSFEYMADDSAGCRRIKVTDTTCEYSVLALRRFQEAIIDPDYNPEAPLDTPSDYRVMRWVIDRAKPALILFIEDRLNKFVGNQESGEAGAALKLAVNRQEYSQIRDNRLTPAYPMFGRRR